MRKRLSSVRIPAKAVISVLSLAVFSLPALAQNAGAGPASPAASPPGAENAPQAAITRTQPTAPIPANAPRFVSSGIEIKISSFGVTPKVQSRAVSVAISVILINNNDYDVGVLNVESFNLIDNAGHSLANGGTTREIQGIATCYNEVRFCGNPDDGAFVPYQRYTVISARSAIPTTFVTHGYVDKGDIGDLFTFTTKLLMYKLPAESEGTRKSKIDAPRLITVGIPNIIAKSQED